MGQGGKKERRNRETEREKEEREREGEREIVPTNELDAVDKPRIER